MTKFKTYYLYFTVFITGAVVLIIEILGTRVLAPFYGSTIFVWSSLISVTLGFLALGYWLGGLWVDRRPDFKVFYGIIFLAGVFISLIMKVDQPVLVFTDQFGLRFGPLVASAILFAVSFFLLGMVTPFAIRLRTHLLEKIGTRSGSIFASATAGSLIGALLAGFVLLPSSSLTAIFTATGITLFVLSLLGFFVFGKPSGKELALILPIIILLSFSFAIPKFYDTPKGLITIIYHEQSFFGDIKITERLDYRCLYVNGSGQTCVDSEGKTDGFFKRFLRDEVSNLGLKKDSKILLLGLGGGASILSFLPKNVFVDIVELDPEIYKLAKSYFGFHERDGIRVFIDDARHFLSTNTDQYDLILENIALGNAVPYYLLTQESFSDMKRLLTPDGVLLAHIGTHEVDGDNAFNQAVYSTAAHIFENIIAISSQKNQTANLVLYLSNNTIKYHFRDGQYPANLSFDIKHVVTDEKNPLDYLYTSNAMSQRENTILLGNELFYAQ